jgi:hypothetical protein
MIDYDVELYRKFQKSPIFFIEKMWGLTPQPLKKEYKKQLEEAVKKGEWDKVKADWFEPFVKAEYKSGKITPGHITWQQWLILLAVEKALRGEAVKRVSVRSGHGIGKSADLSWLVLWFLFCFKDAQIPCTAPTSQQMHDILWKEIAVWLNRMPEKIKELYDWTGGYVRMVENPETWFARAQTARKENPEALAGVHGEYVMFIIDEGPGVPEEIFNTAEGALTNENILVVMIGNPTRLIGYFYDSHKGDRHNWQTLHFNSEDSPIVDPEFIRRIIEKHGEGSDEHKIRVLGEFPQEDAVDEKGYVPLLVKDDLKYTANKEFVGRKRLGVDPAGEGSNETTWVVRDQFRARIVAKETISNEKSIAQKTLSLVDHFEIKDDDIIVDNFGVGANVVKQLALSDHDVQSINVGDKPKGEEDEELYMNQRAFAYMMAKKWIRSGGELIRHEDWEQLLGIRYKRELSGKIKIMSKEDMRKNGIPSPDAADAFMLTFIDEEDSKPIKIYKQKFEPRSPYQGE